MLRYVDRSRSETGREHCQRNRYQTYHAGPHGYGWQKKAQSVPAVTGQRIHDPVGEVLEWVRQSGLKGGGQQFPPDAVVHGAITKAVNAYLKTVQDRGLVMTAGEDFEQRVHEQVCLIEGMVWVWARAYLPQFLAEWEVVSVEREGGVVVGCTCGLGSRVGEFADHDARECEGYGWMTRADCVARRKAFPHTHAYHEVKTTTDASMNWEGQWPHRNQLMAGILGEERRLGVTIDEVYITAMVKGRRQAEWNPEEGKASGPRFQNSPLVYGWFRPANPPLLAEGWAAEFYYFDDGGKRRKLTKDYSRTGIWTLGENYWKAGGCLSALDFWTRWLGPDKLRTMYRVVGPIYRQDWKLKQWEQQLVAEEKRVDQGLLELYEGGQQHPWGSPQMEAILDAYFPMARGSHCHGFFGDLCPMLPLCNREPGWEDPALLGFIPRRPHHEPELQQAVERGLLPPDEGMAEDVEEE